MRIGVLSSLYPSAVRPREGLFAEQRWVGMRLRGHAVRIAHPIPQSSWIARVLAGPLRRPAWREAALFPPGERRKGIEIGYPRYRHLPGRDLANARAFALAGVRALLGSHGGYGAQAPEVVVLDYAWPAAAAAPLLAECGLACVINGRGSDVLQVGELPELAAELARALRVAGSWCAVSQDLVLRMDELAGVPGRGRLVPNGVDRERFAPRARAPERAALWPGSGPLVLAVGHLIARKDPLLALEAFASGAPPQACLAFVGSGPLERELRARAAALALGARVRLLGELEPEALARWYTACDALLLTGAREGRPNVVLEALASGRPVLATHTPGAEELLASLPECLVRERTPAAVGAALARLLAAPPAAERIAAAVEPFTWERSLAALEDCLAQARPGRVS